MVHKAIVKINENENNYTNVLYNEFTLFLGMEVKAHNFYEEINGIRICRGRQPGILQVQYRYASRRCQKDMRSHSRRTFEIVSSVG